MASFGNPGEAQEIAADLIRAIEKKHGHRSAMLNTAAVAMVLGAMVGALEESNVTKAGSIDRVLAHLFGLARAVATSDEDVK